MAALCHFKHKYGIRHTVWAGIATTYGLGGTGIESPWGARFTAPVQTGPGTHPATHTVGTGSLPGVKRPGRVVDHLTSSSAEVKEGVELSAPLWAIVACYRVTFTYTRSTYKSI